MVWWIAVALGVFAALINLPVKRARHRAAARAGWRMKLRPALAYAAAGAALLLVFAAYLRPDLVMTLANQLWACF